MNTLWISPASFVRKTLERPRAENCPQARTFGPQVLLDHIHTQVPVFAMKIAGAEQLGCLINDY